MSKSLRDIWFEYALMNGHDNQALLVDEFEAFINNPSAWVESIDWKTDPVWIGLINIW